MVGQFFTPHVVAKCMYQLAGARFGQRVIDPSCGDGAFLRAAPKGLDLYGCEMDPQHASASKALLPAGRFEQGDALTGLMKLRGKCDLAIGNPPFSAQTSLEKRADVLGGFDLGAGRKSQCLEVLFLELFLKLVKPGGRIAVILPDGPLSNKPFQYVREWLLCRAHVETIMSLPRGIFPQTMAKTNILVARRLPVSAQPCREPTRQFECEALSDLKTLRLAKRRSQSVILADVHDWRPEARSRREEPSESVRLGDLFSLRTGYAVYAKKRELFDVPGDNRITLIRAKNIAPGGGMRLDQDHAHISRGGEMFRERAVVRSGEILFVRVGAGCYGRTAVVPPGLAAQADDWIHVLSPLVEVDSVGVVEWFHSEAGRAAVRQLAKGVGTVSISKASLAELRIPSRLRSGKRAPALPRGEAGPKP